jgi:hypothetical protein
MSFIHLPEHTRRTRRHNREEDFLSLVNNVSRLVTTLPQNLRYVLYNGSASWLGSEEGEISWQHQGDLTIWKLCYYGTDDYAFGVRVLYANNLQSLQTLSVWDRRFQVPPHYHDHQWFVGFAACCDQPCLDRIAHVIRVANDDLLAKNSPGA